MVAEIIKTILEILKLAPRYLIALGVIAASLLLILSPDYLLHKIGVYQFVQDYRSWLGLTLITATVLLLVSLTVSLSNGLKKWWRTRQERQCIIRRLQRLTEEEKQILRYYIGEGTRSNSLRVDDGVVNGLVAAGIIYPSAQLGSLLEGVAHNIIGIAWDYLNQFPDLLHGVTNTSRNDRRDRRGW